MTPPASGPGTSTGAEDAAAGTATVTFYEDGPMLVRGAFVLRTPEGEIIDPGRATVALCRCGRSARKPFCDGSHKAIRFRSGSRPDAGSGPDAAQR